MDGYIFFLIDIFLLNMSLRGPASSLMGSNIAKYKHVTLTLLHKDVNTGPPPPKKRKNEL